MTDVITARLAAAKLEGMSYCGEREGFPENSQSGDDA